MIESLESRRLMAAGTSVTQVGSTLVVVGSSENDTITVNENNGVVQVNYVNSAGEAAVKNAAAITAIQIAGMGGDDQIFYTGNSIGADIHGDRGQGNDDVKHQGKGNPHGNDFISVLDSGTGASTVNGDHGDDSITVLAGNATGKVTLVYGGQGDDTIFLNTAVGVYNTAGARTSVFAESGHDSVTVYDGINTIAGGGGKDTLLDFGGTNTVSGFETEVVV